MSEVGTSTAVPLGVASTAGVSAVCATTGACVTLRFIAAGDDDLGPFTGFAPPAIDTPGPAAEFVWTAGAYLQDPGAVWHAGGGVEAAAATPLSGQSALIGSVTASASFSDRPGAADSGGDAAGDIFAASEIFDATRRVANLVLDPNEVYPAFLVPQDRDAGTRSPTVCYCAGTRIRTPAGDVPIEALALGDCVVTAFQMNRAIRWLGRRSYPAGAPPAIAPVRIAAGAIKDGVPARDLWLSPNHAICIDRVLIPVAALVNGVSVTQPLPAGPVSYIHLELGTPDLLLAEGLPAESFIDIDGSAALFDNAYIPGPPARSSVRRLEEGPELAAIRRRLAARAGLSGDGTVSDSGVHLLADGERVAPEAGPDGITRFRLARRPARLRLRSRSAVPAHLDIGADRRRLGVMLHGLRFATAEGAIDVPAADKLLSEGFYPPEGRSRWTTGDAAIPVPRRRGALTVDVQMTPLPAYPG